jgi:hypothetical protein
MRVVVLLLVCFTITGARARAGELTTADFSFDGPLGSQGASIEQVGADHFRITLGAAPGNPSWANMLQFEIRRNARGRKLRLDVSFPHPRPRYGFSDYFYSWSHDGENWRPIRWEKGSTSQSGTLIFPEFTEDRVIVGHQVPMSYEDLAAHIERWRKSPFVRVHVAGRSLQGRKLYRLEITDFQSPHPPEKRWVHYLANQHPGEHNSQWRMVGMIDWLLSDEAADARRRTICHFVPMMSPDAPAHGWYRVNAEGVDMNRSYRAEGADPNEQTHEAYLWQRDLERLMRFPAPVTSVWSLHTWQGIVEPILQPGPEIGRDVAQWEHLKELIQRYDTRGLIKLLKTRPSSPDTYWTGGPHKQFGVTAVLCEGGGSLTTKEENVYTGEALMRSIVAYYRGLRP